MKKMIFILSMMSILLVSATYAGLHFGIKGAVKKQTKKVDEKVREEKEMEEEYREAEQEKAVGNANVEDVRAGKTFSKTGSAGLTGTMPDKEGDNASTVQTAAGGVNYFTAPTGFYDGDDRVSATDAEIAALDTDITAGNIKNAVAIFGVTGTYTGDWGLPKTGQETSYATNDDADYADPASEDVGYTRGEGTWAGWNADGGRFTNNDDGTITDNATGLMWVADPSAAGVGGIYTWANAITACEGLTYATYTDWRLPNTKELMSIIDYGTFNPVIDTNFFTSPSDYYWSSTTYAPVTTDAWRVSFYVGDVGLDVKTNTWYVRPVRDGQ